LWFSDYQLWLRGMTGTVLAIDMGGTLQTVVEQVPGGPPTGLGWLPDGRLLVVAARGRSLLALGADGSLSTHAGLGNVAAYPCNDMVVDASGRVYLGTADPPPAPPRLSQLIVVHPDGRVDVADSAMRYPNGAAITPGGETLIVAESQGECLTAFTIAGDGTLGDKRVWAAVPGMAPDGLCLDQEGCVWFADAGGNSCVRVAEGGEIKDRVDCGQGTFACALGGDDGRTLFVTTSSFPTGGDFNPRPGRIVAYQVNVPGTGSP
jgi:sugar lactone lactonase YvrE